MKKAIAIAALAVALTAPASAQTTEWKFYTYFANNDKPTQLHRAFAEDVTKATGGKLKITVFSSGELPYKASDVLRTVASNQVEIGDVALGFVAGDVPELNAFAMPFACTSIDKFYDAAIPAVSKTVDNVLSQRFKTASVMHWTMPPQQLWLVKSRRQSRRPEGPEGARLESRAGRGDAAGRRLGSHDQSGRSDPLAAAPRGRRRLHGRGAGA